MSRTAAIEKLIQPVIEGMGFDYWGCELHSSGKYTILRVYIDALETSEKKGVSIDDCASVSNQLSALLDVENPIAGNYSLEVSSPGMDRSFFKLEHYKKYIGSLIKVTLLKPVGDRRNYSGNISAVDDGVISLLVDNETFAIPFSNIAKANLVPNF
jgi:ribosome maturation factor RimP